ncbi:MAG: hypothetical protein M3Q55_11770 [Acidobacteriota bacterium]|nr:hypothetical protein [Acidobacteriota bacterium]
MTTAIKISFPLSDRRPISIVEADWPIVARADWHSGEHECQANEVAHVEVREHADGRRVVFASRGRGPGGMAVGYRGVDAGYLIAPGPGETRLPEPESYDDAVALFSAVFGRAPDVGEGDQGELWSHVCAAAHEPDDAATVRAIRRVAGAIGHEELGAEAIGDLPAEEI